LVPWFGGFSLWSIDPIVLGSVVRQHLMVGAGNRVTACFMTAGRQKESRRVQDPIIPLKAYP
jgi:hypothetical protein